MFNIPCNGFTRDVFFRRLQDLKTSAKHSCFVRYNLKKLFEKALLASKNVF